MEGNIDIKIYYFKDDKLPSFKPAVLFEDNTICRTHNCEYSDLIHHPANSYMYIVQVHGDGVIR